MKTPKTFKTSAFWLLIFFLSNAFAQEQATQLPIEWSGYLDIYYLSSPQAHKSTVAGTTTGPAVIEGRYFDRIDNQVVVNMVEISAKKKVGKLGFRVDLGFGEMVDQLSGGSAQYVGTNAAANESTRNLTQAIVSYSPVGKLTINAGKFYTHMGYEVTKAKDNWQYSRSYTFNYASPIWHQGANVNYLLLPGKFSSTVYFLNAWDGRISQEQNKTFTGGLNLNFVPVEGLTINYNYIGGPEVTDQRREVHEVNALYVINDMWSVATDLVWGSQKGVGATSDAKWTGYAFYAKVSPVDWYVLSPRYEIFDDSDQGVAIAGSLLAPSPTKQKITSFTLSNNFNLGDGLEARLEYRTDTSDKNTYFINKDGTGTDKQDSYTLAVLFGF